MSSDARGSLLKVIHTWLIECANWPEDAAPAEARKMLDAYDHELAERIRSLRDGADYAPDSVEYKHMSGSADWIDPEVSK